MLTLSPTLTASTVELNSAAAVAASRSKFMVVVACRFAFDLSSSGKEMIEVFSPARAPNCGIQQQY